ncbi:MAG: hypothetical protein ACYC92_15260 [Candidatus Acidiferrales bacterium]
MSGRNKQSWMALCEQAATEHEPAKLMKLVQEINDLLGERRNRLTHDVRPEPGEQRRSGQRPTDWAAKDKITF